MDLNKFNQTHNLEQIAAYAWVIDFYSVFLVR